MGIGRLVYVGENLMLNGRGKVFSVGSNAWAQIQWKKAWNPVWVGVGWRHAWSPKLSYQSLGANIDVLVLGPSCAVGEGLSIALALRLNDNGVFGDNTYLRGALFWLQSATEQRQCFFSFQYVFSKVWTPSDIFYWRSRHCLRCIRMVTALLGPEPWPRSFDDVHIGMRLRDSLVHRMCFLVLSWMFPTKMIGLASTLITFLTRMSYFPPP